MQAIAVTDGRRAKRARGMKLGNRNGKVWMMVMDKGERVRRSATSFGLGLHRLIRLPVPELTPLENSKPHNELALLNAWASASFCEPTYQSKNPPPSSPSSEPQPSISASGLFRPKSRQRD